MAWRWRAADNSLIAGSIYSLGHNGIVGKYTDGAITMTLPQK